MVSVGRRMAYANLSTDKDAQNTWNGATSMQMVAEHLIAPNSILTSVSDHWPLSALTETVELSFIQRSVKGHIPIQEILMMMYQAVLGSKQVTEGHLPALGLVDKHLGIIKGGVSIKQNNTLVLSYPKYGKTKLIRVFRTWQSSLSWKPLWRSFSSSNKS